MTGERLSIEVIKTDAGSFQQDIHALSGALRSTNQGLVQSMFVRDGAGGGATQLATMSGALAPYAASVVTAFAGWFVARAGRRVRLKIGEVEVEASTVEEVENLLALVDARKSRAGEGGANPG